VTNPNSRNRNETGKGAPAQLKVLRKSVYLRVGMVFLIVALTIILVFALTVAWYVNVVQSSNLNFTAETWNFTGEIDVENPVFSAAPGDNGVVSMSLKNDSSSLVAASVTVSKAQLNDDMRDKLFFYVDTTATRNSETVERVYISSSASYTYTIFPFGEIAMTDHTYNAARIMWEWPYDTLGYYVLGTVTPTRLPDIDEYLRPIEYEYDEQNTTFNSAGELLTIDGVTPATDFLVELSQTDGYRGVIDPGAAVSGYYPVDVDANGYGVWAYFCTYAEIQSNNRISTELGENNADIGSVQLQVIGQNSREEGISVSSPAELTAVLYQDGLHMVRMEQDIELSQSIQVGSNTGIMIDMQGHTLTSTASTVIDAKPGSNVMLYNGTLDGANQAETAIYASGGVVTLNGVTIENVEEGLKIFDNENNSNMDSTIRLFDCKIMCETDGLWIKGNGAKSEKKTVVVIENCEMMGEGYAGLLCNGTYYGCDIRVSGDSKISGKYAGIYFPTKDSTLTVENSTIEGYTGLVVKGGSVEVNNSVIIGIGERNDPDPDALSQSGWTDTGDGVYLEANYTNWLTDIRISGENTRVVSMNAEAVRMCPDGLDTASITITGGSFSSVVGYFNKDTHELVQFADDVYVVRAK